MWYFQNYHVLNVAFKFEIGFHHNIYILVNTVTISLELKYFAAVGEKLLRNCHWAFKFSRHGWVKCRCWHHVGHVTECVAIIGLHTLPRVIQGSSFSHYFQTASRAGHIRLYFRGSFNDYCDTWPKLLTFFCTWNNSAHTDRSPGPFSRAIEGYFSEKFGNQIAARCPTLLDSVG